MKKELIMSRWTIEKNGTGIEKSGTGIEKSGTGIEKSGTGIEKSGTGIEKSGTGIRKGLLACSIAALAFTTQLSAAGNRPEGFMQVAVDQGQVSVMWNIDGNTFIGKGSQVGTFSQVSLIELSINDDTSNVEIAGGGTGVQIAGGGTGLQIAGGGTGVQIAGGGTGVQIAGGGTGVQIAGGGTGVQIAGGGTGVSSILITLPDGTGLDMEIVLGCDSATVSVLDSENLSEIVTFTDVKVVGDTGLCQADAFERKLERKVYGRKANRR
jgi:hypothetical protein